MIMLIPRVFDGGSDVIMGILTDRTHSRHGKARPRILWMTIPYGVSAVAMFMIPAGAIDMFKAVYILVTYNLVPTVVYTALTLPYGTLASLMTRNQHEREITNILRMGVSPFGRILTTSCTLPLAEMNTLFYFHSSLLKNSLITARGIRHSRPTFTAGSSPFMIIFRIC